MINNPVHGEIYWCCCPSVESENYNDTCVCKPWRGEYRVVARPGMNREVMVRVNDQNEPDEDSNAIAIVTKEDIFRNREEAVTCYLLKSVKELHNDFLAIENKMSTLLESVAEIVGVPLYIRRRRE